MVTKNTLVVFRQFTRAWLLQDRRIVTTDTSVWRRERTENSSCSMSTRTFAWAVFTNTSSGGGRSKPSKNCRTKNLSFVFNGFGPVVEQHGPPMRDPFGVTRLRSFELNGFFPGRFWVSLS